MFLFSTKEKYLDRKFTLTVRETHCLCLLFESWDFRILDDRTGFLQFGGLIVTDNADFWTAGPLRIKKATVATAI